MVKIDWDPAKREVVLQGRGLDFADCIEVFAGPTYDTPDPGSHAKHELRVRTFGFLIGRLLSVVWTPRGGVRRIISMRKANDREKEIYRQQLGES